MEDKILSVIIMKKILIIRLSAIGDTIHVLPSLNLLRQYFSDDYIGWVVCDKSSSLLIDEKKINKTFVLSNKFPKSICQDYQVISELYKIKWDIIIDYQNIFKSLILRFFLRGSVYTYHYNNCYLLEEKISYYFSHYSANFIQAESIIEQELKLTQYICHKNSDKKIDKLYFDLNFDFKVDCKNKIDNWLNDNNLSTFIVLAPNTSRPEKKWNQNNWINLITRLNNKNIVIIGSNLDSYTLEISNYVKHKEIIFIAPNFDLREIGYLLSKSKLVISHDSCIIHLANILNCNVLGLFGPTCAKWYGGNYNKNYKYLQADTKFIRHKNYSDKDCINQITVEEVLNKIYLITE